MIINIKSRLIETIEKYTNINNNVSNSENLSSDSIGLIIGLIIISLGLISLILCISYCLPCFNFFNLCCYCFILQSCFNWAYLYDTCCRFMDSKALTDLESSRMTNQIYVQDMVMTPDGRIIQYTNPRPIFNKLSKSTSSRQFSDSDLI
ncbi:unnamed protein product [Brachionus calyciflorus]|uniref:Uncharacterized protein n=1 Tax=Brachionus calyciflorus TaxID=104777 RepID=A0A813WP60_9BILA|nr:unnamed protein product [Brachionus calyciflorus]